MVLVLDTRGDAFTKCRLQLPFHIDKRSPALVQVKCNVVPGGILSLSNLADAGRLRQSIKPYQKACYVSSARTG
jgi:hypothetical protein